MEKGYSTQVCRLKKQQGLVDGLPVCLQGQYSPKGSVNAAVGPFCADNSSLYLT